MMPPYAFRLSRPTKSFSHSNIKQPETTSKNPYFKHNMVTKIGVDSMSEFQQPSIPQSKTKDPRNNPFSDKLWDNEAHLQTQTSLVYGFQKQMRELSKFFEQLGIQVDAKNCKQQTIIDIILNQVRPTISAALNKNRESTLQSNQSSITIKNQQHTIRYLEESNRLLQSNQSHIKHKFQHLMRQWEQKCRQIMDLHQQIQLKDDELVKLKSKVDNLNRQLNKIIVNQELASRQALDESKRRIQVQKQVDKLKNQKRSRNQERQALLSEKQIDLAENEIRLKVVDEKARLLERKYDKLKTNYNKLLKESEQKQHFLHLKIEQLEQELHNQIMQRKNYHQIQKELRQKVFFFERENQELKEELSALTERFLKLKQFEKIDRPHKKSINSVQQ